MVIPIFSIASRRRSCTGVNWCTPWTTMLSNGSSLVAPTALSQRFTSCGVPVHSSTSFLASETTISFSFSREGVWGKRKRELSCAFLSMWTKSFCSVLPLLPSIADAEMSSSINRRIASRKWFWFCSKAMWKGLLILRFSNSCLKAEEKALYCCTRRLILSVHCM